MNNSLSTLVNRALPALSGSRVTFDRSRNMFVTSSYTSAMGHSYYQGIQVSDRVAVVYNIGRGGWGSCPLFLNGVTVYCFDGTDKRVIGSWSPQGWSFYSDSLAHSVAKEILFNYLKSQMRLNGVVISDRELTDYAKAQIDAAVSNQPLLAA